MNIPQVETLNVQDTIHKGTKLRNMFLNKDKVFEIGDKMAKPTDFAQLISMLPKSIHLLRHSDLDNTDKMNFKSV